MSQQTGNGTVHPKRGIVKQVLSGDTLVIRGQPRNGPPPERTLALSGITAPRLARRANPNIEKSVETKEEPYAWEAREYLRKLLVGKEVSFIVEYTTNTKREYGTVKVKVNGEEVSVIDQLLSEGLAEVRQTARESEELQRLNTLEATAKSAGKGKWSKDTKPVSRDITWSMTNDELRTFVQRNTGKEVDAVIEHVRDGSTLRAILLPSFTIVTVAMAGIKCPTFKRDGDKETPEPFAEQAKFYTESRLLHQDVKVLIEGVSNQFVLATVIHPAGNIAESLLKQGYARCVDWSMASVTRGKEKLRAAEKKAKQDQLRLWKGYTPTAAPDYAGKSKNFTGRVVEVGHADNISVKTTDGALHKIHFSSVRPPRPVKEEDSEGSAPAPPGGRARPLYDTPYMFEAREFLRKKLIGKKVNVVVDYIKPAQDRFPEKVCCTVTTVVGDKADGVNVAEALISKGLAYCLRHRQDDDQRSSAYDELMTAEARALRNGKGVHSKKEAPLHRVADTSQDTTKAKQFLPFLQRAGRTVALVEFVASGSRVRLYLPKDTCLINFILAGLSCPRAPNQRDGPGSGEPFGQDALLFTKELIMQREVEVEVEAADKGGNFIGSIFVDGKNLAVLLLEAGLCKVFAPSAERSQHGRLLFEAEEVAKKARKKIWEDYVEPAAEESTEDGEAAVTGGGEESTPPERQVSHRKIIVTEVVNPNNFWAQLVDQGPQFNTLMEQLRQDLTTNPPLPGSFAPTKGCLCVAKFSDGLWYRAKVERIDGKNAHVLYIDFGNKQLVPSASLGALPAGYRRLFTACGQPTGRVELMSQFVGTVRCHSQYLRQPAQAQEFYLACVIPPEDEDWVRDAYAVFCQEVMGKTMLLNTEYKNTGQSYVSLLNSDDQSDVARKMISEGLARVDRRKDRRLAKLVGDYCKAEEEARRSRLGIWLYGDSTPDVAAEFGYKK